MVSFHTPPFCLDSNQTALRCCLIHPFTLTLKHCWHTNCGCYERCKAANTFTRIHTLMAKTSGAMRVSDLCSKTLGHIIWKVTPVTLRPIEMSQMNIELHIQMHWRKKKKNTWPHPLIYSLWQQMQKSVNYFSHCFQHLNDSVMRHSIKPSHLTCFCLTLNQFIILTSTKFR